MHALPFCSSCSPKIRLVLSVCSLQWYKPEWFVGLSRLMPVSALLKSWKGQGRQKETPECQAFSSCDPCVIPAWPQHSPWTGPRTGSQTWYLTLSIWKAELPRVENCLNIPGPPQSCPDLPFWHPKTCKVSTELQELIQTKCPFSWGSGLLSSLFNAALRSRIFTTGCFFIVTVKQDC